ncbi:hypothetical protein ABIC83_000172 [Roseateles asaccharophilus]
MKGKAMSESDDVLAREIALLFERARIISADLGEEVEAVFGQAEVPKLTAADAASLLNRVVEVVRMRQRELGQTPLGEQQYEALMSQVRAARATAGVQPARRGGGRAPFQEYGGISPHPVKPVPVFHTREVAVTEGYVRTRDLDLWDSNERIEIHLQQFQRKHARKPTPEELLEIMFSRLKLEGVTENDQFQIPALARSIATNGLRKPPILASDGRLLDGNRRLAACYYILLNDGFTTEQKKRVDYILVWQLTEHSTPADEDSVIVSLNFEDDHKQAWPEYVKARKVFDEYETAIQLEGGRITPERERQIKRDVSMKFALGSDTRTVSRYIKMVQMAKEFEDHHIVDRERDRFEVQHKAADKFQYFDELSKGSSPGGVSWCLGQNEPFKNLVFELLYTDKFKKWSQIRDLRLIYENDEALQLLRKAANTPVTSPDDLDQIQDDVDDALAIGRVRRSDQRAVGADTRIETFVGFLEGLSVKAIAAIKPGNLVRLQRALRIVNAMVEQQTELFAEPTEE